MMDRLEYRIDFVPVYKDRFQNYTNIKLPMLRDLNKYQTLLLFSTKLETASAPRNSPSILFMDISINST